MMVGRTINISTISFKGTVITYQEGEEGWECFLWCDSVRKRKLSRIIHFASNVKKFVSNKTKSPFACFRPTLIGFQNYLFIYFGIFFTLRFFVTTKCLKDEIDPPP